MLLSPINNDQTNVDEPSAWLTLNTMNCLNKLYTYKRNNITLLTVCWCMISDLEAAWSHRKHSEIIRPRAKSSVAKWQVLLSLAQLRGWTFTHYKDVREALRGNNMFMAVVRKFIWSWLLDLYSWERCHDLCASRHLLLLSKYSYVYTNEREMPIKSII
jgi:hypothetical protein